MAARFPIPSGYEPLVAQYEDPPYLGMVEMTTAYRLNFDDVRDRGPTFSSSMIGPGPYPTVKLIAIQDIPPDTQIYSDHLPLLIPAFLVPCPKDHVYKFIDIRSGTVPENWVCICCLTPVGPTVPVWCLSCDLPLCEKCGSPGLHHKIDVLCNFVRKVDVRGRRFMDLGNVYLDVSITRFLFLEYSSPSFRLDMFNLMKDPTHAQMYLAARERLGSKVSLRALPISFAAGHCADDILRSLFILTSFVNPYNPRADVCAFHPILSRLTPSCFPNVQVINNISSFELWTTKWIPTGQLLNLDFMQKQHLPTVYRQRLFNSRWGFSCNCEKCTDPTQPRTCLI